MPSVHASLKTLAVVLALGLAQPAFAQDATAPAAQASVELTGAAVLLEAPRSGDAGVVRSEGLVAWSKGVDTGGLPTLIAHVEIPARKLTLDVVMAKNTSPDLAATHLFDVKFTESYGFTEGSVSGLPGVLTKAERDGKGAPLNGVSSRIVDNQFLFALNADPAAAEANIAALKTQPWIDVALIYATGRQGILTIEKPAAAQALFTEVMAAWGE